MDSQLSLPVMQEITGLTPPMHVTWLVNDPMRKPFLSFREFVELQRGGGKSRDKCENFDREPHGLQKSQGGISWDSVRSLISSSRYGESIGRVVESVSGWDLYYNESGEWLMLRVVLDCVMPQVHQLSNYIGLNKLLHGWVTVLLESPFQMVKVLVAQSCPTLWPPVVCQSPLFMGSSRQEYWSGLLVTSPGDLPDPGIRPRSPMLQADALPSEQPGKPKWDILKIVSWCV